MVDADGDADVNTDAVVGAGALPPNWWPGWGGARAEARRGGLLEF